MSVRPTLHPLRSRSEAARGGIAACLGNSAEDSWDLYMFDAVKVGEIVERTHRGLREGTNPSARSSSLIWQR